MAEPVTIELFEPVRSAPGEQALWVAALTLLIEDARGYAQGKRAWSTPPETAEQAYQDVLSVGPMLTRLCEFTGHDAVWVSEAFRREWCAADGLAVSAEQTPPALTLHLRPNQNQQRQADQLAKC